MHFAKSLLVCASAFAVALAQSSVQFTTNPPTSVSAGSSVNLAWSGSTGPVTIELLDDTNSNVVTVLSTYTASGGSASVTIPTGVGSEPLAFRITPQGGTPNYSSSFTATGGDGTLKGSSAGTVSATGSASASGSTTGSASITGSASTTLTVLTSTTSTSTPFSNSTTTTSTTSKSSSTKSSSSTSSTSSSTSAPNPNSAAHGLASPLALILSAIVAMIYLH